MNSHTEINCQCWRWKYKSYTHWWSLVLAHWVNKQNLVWRNLLLMPAFAWEKKEKQRW